MIPEYVPDHIKKYYYQLLDGNSREVFIGGNKSLRIEKNHSQGDEFIMELILYELTEQEWIELIKFYPAELDQIRIFYPIRHDG